MSLKLKLLLLLLLNGTWTAFSQPKPDSTVTITNKQAQFFIQWHLRAKSLMIDTSLLNKQIKALGGIIVIKNQQLYNDSLMYDRQKIITNTYKDSYTKMSDKYDKSQKKLKFFKNSTAILGSLVVLETIVLVLIKG